MSPQTETIDSLECVTRDRSTADAFRLSIEDDAPYCVIASLQMIEGT